MLPTVLPAKDFDVEADAKVLHKAMTGFGTDEEVITDIVANRSSAQLKVVEKKYKELFGGDLKKRIAGELTGSLEKIVVGRFYEKLEYQAYLLNWAMAGFGTDEQTLIDIICCNSPEDMIIIKGIYEDMFGHNLIKNIKSETGGHLSRILVSIAAANREKKKIDSKQAKEDAKMLYDAGVGTWGTEERVFIQIFATRSLEQLKLTFQEYHKISGNSIFHDIENEMAGYVRAAFLELAKYIEDPITCYSDMIYNSMSGAGTDENRLIRAVVSRCEIDLKTVKDRYANLHGISVEKKIEQEISGEFRRIMLALLKTREIQAKLNLHFSQKGIPYFPKHAKFLTFFIHDVAGGGRDVVHGGEEDLFATWIGKAQEIEQYCSQSKDHVVTIKGVDYDLWNKWCTKNNMPKPMGMTSHETLDRAPFKNTGGSFWFYIKADKQIVCEKCSEFIIQLFNPITNRYTTTSCEDRHDGRILGGCFPHGLNNPVDEVNMSHRTIVGDKDQYYRGSVYVFQQKFQHNWERIDDMSIVEKELMIGRSVHGAVLPMESERCHLRCVRDASDESVAQEMLRQALPYGEISAAKGKGKEKGVYFVSYANEGHLFEEILENISGPDEGYVKDRLLSSTRSVSGNFWFVPQASLLGLTGQSGYVACPLDAYYDIRSTNGYMFYNNRDFLNKMKSGNRTVDEGGVSDRILLQISETFHLWNDTMRTKLVMPSLGHLKDYMNEDPWKSYIDVAESTSAALRKGLATKISLSDVLWRDVYKEKAGLCKIKPWELIVGNLPPMTLGTGSVVMEYLNPEEKIQFFFSALNEYSCAGHNIPDYDKLLRLGIPGLLDEAETKLTSAVNVETREFYQSVIYSIEGMQSFVERYSELATEQIEKTPGSDWVWSTNCADIANRMKRLAYEKPNGFHDSIQLIFIVNCALHQIGEPMSIGRLDQWLIEAYRNDIKNEVMTPEEAQELIDAFWLKMDEPVLYQRQNMGDYLTYGSGAVFYMAGNFPQGSAMNQWVQQVTVGGYLPTDDDEPIDGCNEITLMCLRSARRLPLNAPCLTLRVHKNMKSELHEQIFSEASRAILSGGAHPNFMNDDKLCPAIAASGPVTKADSRGYCPDGCYEPIIPGKSEWVFSYVPILPIVGMAMNSGATIAGSGWSSLRGLKSCWNSPPPKDIKSFDKFMEIFYTHIKWQISAFYNTLMTCYGALWNVCPSPLFSAMTEGCMESGKDMTNGGATYHIATPEMCGITNTINCLYSIKKLVFDEDSAMTTLPELLKALQNNWGKDMKEPFFSELEGPRKQANAERYANLRQLSLDLPKFGHGRSEELKQFGATVVSNLVRIIREGIENPIPKIKSDYEALKKKYNLEGREFAFTITPGVGTFEDNVGLGADMGASADGRLAGESLGDDFSPVPSPIDAKPSKEIYDVFSCLKDWNTDPINFGLSNASPVNINIREDFPHDEMKRLLKQFAAGELGSNMLSITAGNPKTYEQAKKVPQIYDLVRCRQGGWSEFYGLMFPEHQRYIERRPYYGPPEAKN